MKNKILIAFAILAFTACDTKKKETKEEKKTNDFVVFSGKIINKNSDKIIVFNRNGFKKEILVSSDGSFKDTLKAIKTGSYTLGDGKEYSQLFLENGSDIYMTLDTKQFDETITFKGEGSEESSFLAKSAMKTELFMSDEKNLELSKEEFDKKITVFTTDFSTRLGEIKNVNKEFDSIQKLSVVSLKQQVVFNYDNHQYIKKNLALGMDAPLFNDFLDFKGGTKSLANFKGKYVYIDVWATWCGPCKIEMPYYKELIKNYKGNDKIVFLAISTEAESSFDIWKNMVAEKQVGGVQLLSKRNIDFMKNYRVTGIPRFILIDPNGKIVKAEAPRPSDPKLVELFTSLGIK